MSIEIMNEPLVSVVITTYKRQPHMVLRAVRSVLKQSYQNFEIIIVDDSPSDYEYRKDVQMAIESLGSKKITLIVHEKNTGACVARNDAIALSRGDFIIYLDDDDEYLPECLEKKLSGFVNKDIGLVYSKRYICKDNNQDNMYIPDQLMVAGDIFKYTIQRNNIAAFPMIRKECFQKCGGFNPIMQSAQDYEMWLRILKTYKANFIDKPLAIVHVGEGERITTNPERAIQGTSEICKIYKSYYRTHPRAYHYRKQELSKLYAAKGDRLTSFHEWVKSVLLWPFDIKNNLLSLIMVFRFKY